MSNTIFLETKTALKCFLWGHGRERNELVYKLKLSCSLLSLSSWTLASLHLAAEVCGFETYLSMICSIFFSFLTCRRCTKAAETQEYSLRDLTDLTKKFLLTDLTLFIYCGKKNHKPTLLYKEFSNQIELRT